MKRLLILFIMLAINLASTTQAQDLDNLLETSKEKELNAKKKPTPNNNNFNLLDAQTNTYKSIFGGETVGGVDFGNVEGFLGLVEKMDLSPKQKEQYRKLYFLQRKEPNQKTKDSLGQVLHKRMLEAEKEENKKH